MIAAARLRRGASASVRGAGKLVADVLATARRAGVTGPLVVHGDSAFYAHDVVAACRRAGAHYSLAVREFPSVLTAISRIVDVARLPLVAGCAPDAIEPTDLDLDQLVQSVRQLVAAGVTRFGVSAAFFAAHADPYTELTLVAVELQGTPPW